MTKNDTKVLKAFQKYPFLTQILKRIAKINFFIIFKLSTFASRLGKKWIINCVCTGHTSAWCFYLRVFKVLSYKNSKTVAATPIPSITIHISDGE